MSILGNEKAKAGSPLAPTEELVTRDYSTIVKGESP
jgi:hypothetical protein